MKKILFLCTGNSCRSQIADGIAHNIFNSKYHIESAGTEKHGVNPRAIDTLKEIDIDISNHTSNHLDDYLDKDFDVVITTCDDANKSCPFFPGNVVRLHWSIDDPFSGWDYDENQIDSFSNTREEINNRITDFLKSF